MIDYVIRWYHHLGRTNCTHITRFIINEFVTSMVVYPLQQEGSVTFFILLHYVGYNICQTLFLNEDVEEMFSKLNV